MSMQDLAQMLSMFRPQTYYGTQTADQVNADAARAQQWAMNQADVSSRNYAADRDFWKGINQMFSDQNLALQKSGYDQQLANINNAAALQKAQMEAEAQRYGYDQSLAGQMAGYDNQRQIADLNAAMQRYTTGVSASTGLQQTQMQTAAQTLPAQLQQQRYNDVSPLIKGLLTQYATPQNGFGMPQPMGYPGAPGVTGAGMSQPQIAQQPMPAFTGIPGTPAMDAYIDQTTNRQTGQMFAPPANQLSDQFIYGAPAATPQPPQGNALGSMLGGYAGGDMSGMGGSSGVSGGGMSSGYGGLPTPPQAVSQTDVVTQPMQNQMVNQALSQNARNYASQVGNAQRQMAGRGWNPRGPGMQYHNQIQNAQYNKSVADMQARTQVPMQAAQTNAQYRLGAAGANTANRSSYWNAYSQQQGNRSSQLATLLNALTGLV